MNNTKIEEIDETSKFKGQLLPIFKEIKHLWHYETEESEFVGTVQNICGSPFIEMYHIDLNQYDEWIETKKEKLFKIITHFHEENSYQFPNPLFASAIRGCMEVAKLLLMCGMDVNSQNDRNETPLYYAVTLNQFEIAKLLLQHGARADHKTGIGGLYQTLLHLAVHFIKSAGMVQILLEHGANVKALDFFRNPPLVYAADENIARLLMKYGTTIQDIGNDRLYFVVASGNITIARLLIANGADLNYQNVQGQTPLYTTVEKDSFEMMKSLLSFGASLEIRDNFGNTVVEHALTGGKTHSLKQLLYDQNN